MNNPVQGEWTRSISTAKLLDDDGDDDDNEEEDDDDDDDDDFSVPCVSNCVIFKHRGTFLRDIISSFPLVHVAPSPCVQHRTVIRKLEITQKLTVTVEISLFLRYRSHCLPDFGPLLSAVS